MNRHDFRIGIRVLGRDPGRSLLAILGLGAGFALAMLLVAYVRYSWGYNTHIPNVDEVYVVKERSSLGASARWRDQVPLLLRNVAKSAPGVTNATGYVNWFPLTVQVNGKPHRLSSLTALPGFDELLGLRVIRGDLREALSRPDAFALTEHAALRLFGTSDVLGRQLQLSTVHQGTSTARVAAILADPPTNTTIPFEALNGLHLSLVPDDFRNEALTGDQYGWRGVLLIRVQPRASLTQVTEPLQQAVDRAPTVQKVSSESKARLGGAKVMDIELAPLRAAYFDRDIAMDGFSLHVERGNRALIAALGAIAVLVLATAAINYVNLAALQVVRRQREIGMRKVVGAGRAQLAGQFLAESLLVAMLAAAVGIALMCMAMPLFSELMKRDFGKRFHSRKPLRCAGHGARARGAYRYLSRLYRRRRPACTHPWWTPR